MGGFRFKFQWEQKFTCKKNVHFFSCVCNHAYSLNLNCRFHFFSRCMDEIYDTLAERLLPTAAVASNPNLK